MCVQKYAGIAINSKNNTALENDEIMLKFVILDEQYGCITLINKKFE